MRVTTTLSAFIAAVELAQATVYLAGDSTMANNGANDGVTDGSSKITLPYPNPTSSLPILTPHRLGPLL
jgi:hypothetical protein